MDKREYLLNKYNSGFKHTLVMNAEAKQIKSIYENEKLTEKALYEGINTYRVNFSPSLYKEIKKYIRENNIKEFKQGTVYKANDFGNYCLPSITEQDALKMKNDFEGQEVWLDLFRHYIGEKELQALNIGDKIVLTIAGMLGNYNCKGTVYKKDNKSIAIRKYHSQTKGYLVKVGEESNIKLGW